MVAYLDGTKTYTFELRITRGTLASLDVGLWKEKSKKKKPQNMLVQERPLKKVKK